MSTPYNLADFRAILRAEKELSTYDSLAEKYGVNKFYLHEIITDDSYIPPASVAARLGIVILRPTPACPDCGAVHTIPGVCVAKSLVKIQVIQMTPEELAAIDRPVTVIVKQSAGVRRKRARASINIADPHSAARTIKRKMDPETLALLLALLREAAE